MDNFAICVKVSKWIHWWDNRHVLWRWLGDGRSSTVGFCFYFSYLTKIELPAISVIRVAIFSFFYHFIFTWWNSTIETTGGLGNVINNLVRDVILRNKVDIPGNTRSCNHLHFLCIHKQIYFISLYSVTWKVWLIENKDQSKKIEIKIRWVPMKMTTLWPCD